MPLLSQGGTDLIRAWIKQAKNPRLVVIDVLAKVRDPRKKDQGLYDADYAAVAGLKAIADEFNIAIVVVTHLRKLEAEDPLDQISSTTGLTGSVDAVMVSPNRRRHHPMCSRPRPRRHQQGRAIQRRRLHLDRAWRCWRDHAIGLAGRNPCRLARRERADVGTGCRRSCRHVAQHMRQRWMVNAGEVLRVRRGCYVHPERKTSYQTM